MSTGSARRHRRCAPHKPDTRGAAHLDLVQVAVRLDAEGLDGVVVLVIVVVVPTAVAMAVAAVRVVVFMAGLMPMLMAV